MSNPETEATGTDHGAGSSGASILTEITSGSVHITGVKMAYYHICHTKLWLFSRNIGLEKEHENVHIGRMLHEERYRRSSKDVTIDNTISIDFVKQGGVLRLHEVKKTRKMEDAHRAQMLFYLYYLKNRGVEARGVINYPLINRTEEIILSPGDEESVIGDIEHVKEIVLGSMPAPERRRICTKCAYFEFCFCGGD